MSEIFYGKDFFPACIAEITRAVNGKTIASVFTENKYDDLLIIQFMDGSELVFKYDWIYEWDVRDSDV